MQASFGPGALVALCISVSFFPTSAHSQNQDEQVLEEVTVVGTDQSRYNAGASSATTGFSLDFLENPRVINQIPEQLVLDQKITDLGEALRNTPGISQSDGFGGTNDDFYIRGFRRNVVYRNGYRRATNFRTNLTNIESTQVIRGPASITYGQVEPGGLVDVITKKPLVGQRIAGELRYGRFDDKLALLDWSQPLTDSAGIRVVASTQDAESFRDFTKINRDSVAISGRFDLSPATLLDIAYEYRDESRPLDRGTVTVNTPTGRRVVNDVVDLPISRRFGEPFEISETDFQIFEANIKHTFNDNWDLSVGFSLEDSTTDDLQARPRSVVILNADAPITGGFFTAPIAPEALFDDPSDLVFLARRTDGSRDRDTEVTYFNALLIGEFETGRFGHRLAVGADYRDLETTRIFVSTATTNGVPESLGGNGPLFDLRNPVYGLLPSSVPTASFPLRTAEEKSVGLFVNDYIDLTERLSLLVGARYDTVEIRGDRVLDEVSEVSPQAAINYRVLDNTSLFISYAEAFEPNFAVDAIGGPTEPFDPEDSNQKELGVKSEFFDGRLQLTGAIYQIEKTNVLTLVNGVPDLLDGQDSQGIEVSLVGQPIAGMNVVAGYAYTDAEILGARDNPLRGNAPRNVAENTFNLWTSYEWQSGTLEGLGLGGGVFHIDERNGDNGNTFNLDSYTLVDLSVWYTLRAPFAGADNVLRLQLALKNAFDEEYFPATGGNERISIGTPRNLFGSISFEF